ncbi:hypothetical protein B0E53_05175 [Micromonospora sp. MH33]|nr:hypothetical protein B0E53_05175 [Micromonospora sp. MH33]
MYRCDIEIVLEALTGSGLAASAGLNAYIPLLLMGLLARYTDLMELPGGWQWLGNGWVLLILAVLLAVEVVADKVPVVDHVNDVVQTVVRPTAGGLAFGAGSSSETVTVSDPDTFFSSHQWVPVVVGVLIALGVHLLKSAARPVINATTAGFGAPVASTAEDATSAVMSVVAILLPVLVLAFLLGFVAFLFWFLRRRRSRRRERRAARAAGFRV